MSFKDIHGSFKMYMSIDLCACVFPVPNYYVNKIIYLHILLCKQNYIFTYVML